jgi:hypothetical protein
LIRAERGHHFSTGERGALHKRGLTPIGSRLLDASGQYFRRNRGRQLALDLLESNALEAGAEIGWHMANG